VRVHIVLQVSEGLTVLGSNEDAEEMWAEPHTLEFFELCAMIVQELSK
jgi:hypothetical protein